MARLNWTPSALRNVARLHAFLAPKSRVAAKRAVRAIRQGVKELARHPEIGRPVEELPPEIREWIIPFGDSAYVVRYQYQFGAVTIVAVRHGKEAGFWATSASDLT